MAKLLPQGVIASLYKLLSLSSSANIRSLFLHSFPCWSWHVLPILILGVLMKILCSFLKNSLQMVTYHRSRQQRGRWLSNGAVTIYHGPSLYHINFPLFVHHHHVTWKLPGIKFSIILLMPVQRDPIKVLAKIWQIVYTDQSFILINYLISRFDSHTLRCLPSKDIT